MSFRLAPRPTVVEDEEEDIAPQPIVRPAYRGDAPDVQTRLGATKIQLGIKPTQKELGRIAERQRLEAGGATTQGGQGMDAPDRTARIAALKAQLGMRPSDQEIKRLNERQRLEGQQGNVPQDRSITPLLAGSPLDPKGTFREQAVAQRRKEIETRRTQRQQAEATKDQANSEAMAKFKATRARYYSDPATGLLVPEKDEQGRELFHATPWAPAQHPKTGRPALEKVDEYGQRQYRTPPLMTSDDPLDENLYAHMGEGDDQPYGTIDELIAHPEIAVAKKALAARTRRNAAMRTAALTPVKDDYQRAMLELATARNEIESSNAELEQISARRPRPEATKETSGGFLGIGASPTEGAKRAQMEDAELETQISSITQRTMALEESVRPGGMLATRAHMAALAVKLAEAKHRRDSRIDQEQHLLTMDERMGADPEANPLFQANRAELLKDSKEVEDAQAAHDRAVAILQRRQQAAQPTPEPAEAEAAGTTTIGGEPVARYAERYGNDATPESVVRLYQRSKEIDESLARRPADSQDRLYPALEEEKAYIDKLASQRLAALPTAAQQQIAKFMDEQVTTKTGAFLRSAVSSLPGAGGGIAGAKGGAVAGAAGGPIGIAAGALVGGLAGAFLADKAANKLAEKVAPDLYAKFKDYTAKDFEQHAYSQLGGRLAGSAGVFKFNSYADAVRSMGVLNKMARRAPLTPAETQVAQNLAMQIGMAGAGSVAAPLVNGQKLEPMEILQSAAENMLFGAPRGQKAAGGPAGDAAPVEPAPKLGPGGEAAPAPIPNENIPAAPLAGDAPALAPEAGVRADAPVAEPAPARAAVAPDAAQPLLEPSPAVATEITPSQVSPDAARAPAAEATPTQAQDYARYQEVQTQWADALKRGLGPDSPEIAALWKENEIIKNRHGGMPPEAPGSAEAAPEAVAPSGGDTPAVQPAGGADVIASPELPAVRGASPKAGSVAPLRQTTKAQQPTEESRPVAQAEPRPPSQMKRPELRAELAAAGIKEVGGVPVDQNENAAQLMNAVGKLRRGQLDEPAALPRDLSGAKPRYSYGEKQYDLKFDSDLDRAAYILAQKTPSKRDADYLKFVTESTGMTEAQARAYGAKVREQIKPMARDGVSGETLRVTGQRRAAQSGEAAITSLRAAKVADAQDRASMARNSAIDLAIDAIGKNVKPANVVKLAQAKFKAMNPDATPEQVQQVGALVMQAQKQIQQQSGPQVAEPEAPKTATSKVEKSMRDRGVPVGTLEYETRMQDARRAEAADIIRRDGAAKAEAAIDDGSIKGDTRVAVGGALIKERMAALSKAGGGNATQIAKDIERIAAKLQPELATESGQTISMFGGIYDDIGTRAAVEYVRSAKKKQETALGGKDATEAVADATSAINKAKTPEDFAAAIEALKKRHSTKPARKVLDAFAKKLEKIKDLKRIGALTRDDMQDIVARELGIEGPSPQKIKHLADIAEKIETAPDAASRSRAELEMADALAVYKGVAAMDVASSILTANILSGYTTQAKNLEGTFLNTFTNLVTTGLANPGKLGPLVRGVMEGIPLGLKQAGSILVTGRGTKDYQDKTGGAGSALANVDFARDFPATGKVGGAILTGGARAVEKVFRFMKAADAVFYYPAREAYARLAATKLLEGKYSGAELAKKVSETLHTTPAAFEAARAQAIREGYKGIDVGRRVADIIEDKRAATPDGTSVVKESERYAARSTFTNEPVGMAGVAYHALKHAVDEARLAGVPVLKPFAMFLKTPANVFNEMTNYFPGVGNIRALRGMRGPGRNGGERMNFTADEQRQLHIKTLIGGALLTNFLARSLSDEDSGITAKGPSDPAKNRQWRDGGGLPYSIKVGDTSVSYKDSPLLLPLAIAGHVADSLRYQKAKSDMVLEDRVVDAMVRSAPVIFDTSMLTGMADLMDALSGKGDVNGVARTLGSIPANLVIPFNRLLSQIDATLEGQSYKNSPLVGAVPFARRTGTPINDVQGRPQTYSPTDQFVKRDSTDAVDALLRTKNVFIPEVPKDTRLAKPIYSAAQAETRRALGAPVPKPGERPIMGEKERDEFRKITGQRIRVRLQAMAPQLRAMSQENAQKEINRIAEMERDRVRPLIGR